MMITLYFGNPIHPVEKVKILCEFANIVSLEKFFVSAEATIIVERPEAEGYFRGNEFFADDYICIQDGYVLAKSPSNIDIVDSKTFHEK